MNRIFSPFGEGWPGFPRRSYGRLDQTEPVVLDGAPEAVFCFDVVDAEWPGFESGHVFDLTNPSADSDESGQPFRLKAASDSDRLRTAFR